MIFKNASRFVGALATMALLSGAASAATVGAGTFSLSGTIRVEQTAFLFGLSSEPTHTTADEMSSVLLPTTGAFSGLAQGDIVGIKNILTPGNGPPFGPGPVIPGTPFLLPQFLTMSTIGVDADLTGLSVNNSLPICSTSTPDTLGFTCTAQPGSPIVLEQGPQGVTAILNLTGNAYFTGSPSETTTLIGKFSANLADYTIASLLTSFYSQTPNFFTAPYSANFITMATPTVPEPASMALLGAGLFGLGLLGKKKLVK